MQLVELYGMQESTDLMELLMQNPYLMLSQPPTLHVSMSTNSKAYKINCTGSDMASLSRLLQVLAQENHPSVETLQLTFSRKGKQLDMWHLKSQTDVQH